jgi:hypothetical protein
MTIIIYPKKTAMKEKPVPNIVDSKGLMDAVIKGSIGTVITGAAFISGWGAISLVGPFAAEAFNLLIPNQRQKRIEELLKILSANICSMDKEAVEQRFNSPEFLDIFEDCVHQAVRATSQDRLEYLASVFEKSLSTEKIQHLKTKHLKTKRLLSIFSELNDIEVIILQSYNYEGYKNDEFKEKHEQIFKNDKWVKDASESCREDYSMFLNYENHLISLGLIGPKDTRKNIYQTYLTPFGGMLLKLVGVEKTIEEAWGTAVSPLTAIQSIRGIAQDSQPRILAGTGL